MLVHSDSKPITPSPWLSRYLIALVVLANLALIAIYMAMPPKNIFEITGWSTDPQDYIKIEIREWGIDKVGRNIEKIYLAEDSASIEELFKHLKAYELKRWYREKTYPLEPSEKVYDIFLKNKEHEYRKLFLISKYVQILNIDDNRIYVIKNKQQIKKEYLKGLFDTTE